MTICYLNFSFSYRETRWKVNSYVKLKDDYLNIGINICILGYIKLKKSLWLNRNFRAQGISVSSLRFVVSEVLFHVQGFFKMRTFFSLAIRISAFVTDDISITRYNCRLTWTDLKILPKFGDQHSIYLGFLRWLNWSVLKNLWKISIVIFSKPLRCVQRKPSTESPPLLQPRSHLRILIHQWNERINDLSVSRNADKCLLPAFIESLFCFFPFIRQYLTQSYYKSSPSFQAAENGMIPGGVGYRLYFDVAMLT